MKVDLERGPRAVEAGDEFVAGARRVRVVALDGVTASLVELCTHGMIEQMTGGCRCVDGIDGKVFLSRLTWRDGAWRMGSGYTAAPPPSR
jgi:hypothetical protein